MNSQKTDRLRETSSAVETERYFWVSLFLMVLGNQIPFQGARLIVGGRPHHSLALPVDPLVPFLPWMIAVYMGCVVYWFFLYRRVSRLPREKADRFFCASLLAKAVCFLFFVFYPTALVRPEVTGQGVWDACLRFMYRIDDADNLFPSLHCVIAWLCWAGVRGNREVSLPWRLSALIMAVAVCVSTLTIRQHVLLDVFGGILLSEICYALASRESLRRLYSALAGGIIGFLFPQREKAEG